MTILFGAPGFDLEPDDVLVGAILQFGLDRLDQIHHLFFVEIVVVDPRDAEGDDVLDFHAGKEPTECAGG